MLKCFSGFHNLLGLLHAYIQDAVAKWLYGMEQAEAALSKAIAIARDDQIIHPFAEYSFYIIDILRSIQNKPQKDDYLDRLVEYSEKYRKNTGYGADAKQADIRLSQREKQVLQLIANGKTDREIASDLFLAEVTVIKTVALIYRKLDISWRVSAVKKAMELNLIWNRRKCIASNSIFLRTR